MAIETLFYHSNYSMYQEVMENDFTFMINKTKQALKDRSTILIKDSKFLNGLPPIIHPCKICIDALTGNIELIRSVP